MGEVSIAANCSVITQSASPSSAGQAEEFFKTRLATVNSPMTWSRLSDQRVSSSSGHLPIGVRAAAGLGFRPPRPPRPPPGTRLASGRGLLSGNAIPRRAITAAGSSRRKKLNTASRRLQYGYLAAAHHRSQLLGFVVATARLRRRDLFSPEKSSHATIPNFYELDSVPEAQRLAVVVRFGITDG